jgi:hypothetical protein
MELCHESPDLKRESRAGLPTLRNLLPARSCSIAPWYYLRACWIFEIDLLDAVAVPAPTPDFRVDTRKKTFHRPWVWDDWRWVEIGRIFDFRFSIFDLGNGGIAQGKE